MRSVLVLGAGRSSSTMIDYLLERASENRWHVTVADVSLSAAQERIHGHPSGTALTSNIEDHSQEALIGKSDVVISVLPAFLHPVVAKKCLQYKKHLITASYVSDEMKSFDDEAKRSGLLFLNECGLDPGIDHMSAMELIDRIRGNGGTVHSFESFTGGLIAPGTDPDNPWRYKFTWNPRNVVMAGQGTAKYLQERHFKFIPYQQLFRRVVKVTVPGHGDFEGYANRDSLKYREAYGLEKISTMLRGTLRYDGFCSAWNILVQLGCTDDSYEVGDAASMTHDSFINSFLDESSGKPTREKLVRQFDLDPSGPEIKRLGWSALFDNTPVGLQKGTPAQILEHILNKRWKLEPTDRDMIVMWHRFKFTEDGLDRELQSSLVVTGENSIQTAMAKTVGLPLGIAAKLLLEGKITSRGVLIPVTKEIYLPVLNELKALGILFQENVIAS